MINKCPSFRPLSALSGFIARLKVDQRGGVLMLMGFAVIPLTFVVGFGVDYSRAMSLQTHLNAAADAAALAAVAPALILRSDSDAQAAAYAMFDAQATMQSGYQNMQRTATVTPGTGGALGYLRKTTVSYTVKSVNVFSGILGADTLTVSGTSTASAAQPPNVDFYLAMDNSPSMLLPATSVGVSQIIAATKNTTDTDLPNGCAFACHAQVPKSDKIFIKDTAGRHILLSAGYYTSGSTKQNVYYRWDQAHQLVLDSTGASMTTTAPPSSTSSTTTSGSGNSKVTTVTTTTTVAVTTYTIPDDNVQDGPTIVNKVVTSTPTITVATTSNGTTTTAPSTPGKVTTVTTQYDTGYWADGYWLTHNYGAIYGSPSSIVLRKDEVASAATQLIPFASNQAGQYHVTYQAQMFSFDWTKPGSLSPVKTLNTLKDVASYGSGFSAASLFPADDWWWKNSSPTNLTGNDDRSTEISKMLTIMKATIPTAGSGAPGATPQKILFIITDGMLDQTTGGNRYFGPLQTSDIAICSDIKANGIKIAILYTQYLPESLVGDTWSQSNVAPLLPKVLPALQLCASPGNNGAPLVQTVTANDDITTALQQLFSTALQSARLVQ
jgi:Flp pilus assembly protein TadG